jgi:hypothetical protein
MDKRKVIMNFLLEAGFVQYGTDQFKRDGTGTIFIREWEVTKVMWQIMELGEKHKAKKIRDILMVQDELFEHVIFNPQS